MDSKNLFFTPRAYLAMRAECALGLILCIVVLLMNAEDVRWVVAFGLFAYIDVIGYIPAAIAYRRSSNGRIHKAYYWLYNTTHSMITNAGLAAAWTLLIGPEWALLALPIHLFGDRSLFGNFVKSTVLAFEPVTHPAYARFRAELEGSSSDSRTYAPGVVGRNVSPIG